MAWCTPFAPAVPRTGRWARRSVPVPNPADRRAERWDRRERGAWAGACTPAAPGAYGATYVICISSPEAKKFAVVVQRTRTRTSPVGAT